MAARRSPLHRYAARRIALIKPSSLGAIVPSLPLLTGRRSRFPAACITWIINRTYAPLLTGHPHLDEVLPFDRHAFRKGYILGTLRFAAFVQELRQRRFDLVIDLQGLLRTGVMAFASGAR